MTDLITQRCIEANPEAGSRNTSMLLKGVFDGIVNHRDTTIRLTDVMLAIWTKDPANRTRYVIEMSGQFRDDISKTLGAEWSLEDDDLLMQSKETWKYLYDILL